jgi:hypothetical protein
VSLRLIRRRFGRCNEGEYTCNTNSLEIHTIAHIALKCWPTRWKLLAIRDYSPETQATCPSPASAIPAIENELSPFVEVGSPTFLKVFVHTSRYGESDVRVMEMLWHAQDRELFFRDKDTPESLRFDMDLISEEWMICLP